MSCGFARFRGDEVMVISNVKGGTTKEKVARRFGMPDPEGYRKALRAMKLAEKFKRPVITLIDLVGANPGLGAEERGQAEAIAHNLREMSRLRTQTIAIITGEGGSGGALALAVSDRVLILEKAVYSVISPESCASIMWRDASRRALAAEALRATADDIAELGCVDEVVQEPSGGAHNDAEKAAEILAERIAVNLAELRALPLELLLEQRYTKFRNMAQFYTS
jgi:acetyl-CoA carboxylase carboxyl transferase subunit alpha